MAHILAHIRNGDVAESLLPESEERDSEGLQLDGLESEEPDINGLSKADEVESKESDDISFCGGLNSEGLGKRRRCRHMNAKQLDGLESEEPDERPMKRKPTNIPSVVDLLKSSDSSEKDSESETDFFEDSRAEDNRQTR